MGSDFYNDPDAVLRGSFGSLVAGAAGGRDAATMWQSLREYAYSAAQSYLQVSGNTAPTEAEIQARGQDLIGHVTILDMNRYTKLAGQFLSAKANLQNRSLTDQIMGDSIFVAPWNRTADNPAIPTRYRINVQRSITVSGFTKIERTEWASYEITSPLTSLQDALDQANKLFGQAQYNNRATINEILDYNIEAV